MVKVKVLDVDTSKERISLGIKQLNDDPFENTMDSIKRGDTVTCTITNVVDGGLEVTIGDGLPGFIRRTDLSRERSEQRPDRFSVGDRLDARVTSIDRKDRKVSLSVKAHDAAEEKQAMAEYGSSDSGASLGDILGAALNRANEERGGDEPEEVAESADDVSEEVVETADDVPKEAAGDDASGEEDKKDE